MRARIRYPVCRRTASSGSRHDEQAVFHAVAVLVLETIFFVLVHSQARRQRDFAIAETEVPLQLGLYTLRVVAAVVGAFEDRIVGTGSAFQPGQFGRVRLGIVQYAAHSSAVNGLQLVPVTSEVIAIGRHLTAPAVAGVDDIAELVLLVLTVEYVAFGCCISHQWIDCKVRVRQTKVSLARCLVRVAELDAQALVDICRGIAVELELGNVVRDLEARVAVERAVDVHEAVTLALHCFDQP